MYKIAYREVLVPNIHLFKVLAPAVARKAREGQFVMLMPRSVAVTGSGVAPAQDIPLPQPRPKAIIADAAPTTTVSKSAPTLSPLRQHYVLAGFSTGEMQ